MRAIFATLLLIGLLNMAGCADPDPGEIAVNCKKDGRSQSCVIVLMNNKGVQIDEKATDEYGVQYIKDLKPGDYTLKFKDTDGNFYPAVKPAKVTTGGSEVIHVELNEAPPAGEAPPS